MTSPWGTLRLTPALATTLINADSRQRSKSALADGEVVDVLVIGGGVTGCGVALDAATRGMSVALVESHDLGHGTSAYSSKLVHGGLRYLASGKIGVAWESAQERAILMGRTAPHLIHRLPQLVAHRHSSSRKERAVIAAGLQAADALRSASGLARRVLPSPSSVSSDLARHLVPGLELPDLAGGQVVWDGQLVDDVRLVVAIARTAAGYGSHILTHTRAVDVAADGAVVHDSLHGDSYTIRARAVINATGVWAGTIDDRIELVPSRGTHVILHAATLGYPRAAMTVPVPGQFGRYVFALPQPHDLLYVGLTDVEVDGPVPDVATAPAEDVEWILEVLSAGVGAEIRPDMALGAYAGLRPLIKPSADSGSSADISRRHLVIGEPGEIVTVTGGKLTTYRRMAQDAVDRVTDRPSISHRVGLVGSGTVDIPASVPRLLVARYGAEAPAVAELAAGDSAMTRPFATTGDGREIGLTAVDALWAITAEGAATVDDIVDRRVRVGLIPADRAPAVQFVNHLLSSVASGGGDSR